MAVIGKKMKKKTASGKMSQGKLRMKFNLSQQAYKKSFILT